MLPPKMGDGVVGSSSGGVKPAGGSFTGASAAAALPSAASALMGHGPAVDLPGLGVAGKDKDDGCFHGAARRVPEFGVERVEERREAWVAMAMRRERESERGRVMGCVGRM